MLKFVQIFDDWRIFMIERNDPCFCGSGKKWKKCHYPEQGEMTQTAQLQKKYRDQYRILLKTPEQIDGIRKACQFSSEVLQKVAAKAIPGVKLSELNRYAEALHKEKGAIAAALGYGHPPFPYSICLSLNEVICHGFADETVLVAGDILNIDVASILDGYFGDCSRMVVISGQTTEERQRVVDTAYDCLMESISILKPGVFVSAIGDKIEEIAHKNRCSVVYQFVAHGVGLQFHENPQIPHHRNKTYIPLAPGMTFTIEPMINAGVADGIIDLDNEWIARTADGKPSAQWEHTVLITPTGHEILTNWVR